MVPVGSRTAEMAVVSDGQGSHDSFSGRNRSFAEGFHHHIFDCYDLVCGVSGRSCGKWF